MPNEVSIEQLADEVRRVCESDPVRAETLVEDHLDKRLATLSARERLAKLQNLAAEFSGPGRGIRGTTDRDEEVLSGVFSLLLGRKVSRADLSSTELLERLAQSLNTIFDTLNQLVSVINATLTSEGRGEETIRQVIGFHIEGEGEGQSESLESYLGQIKQAFLVAQQAFRKAAQVKVNQILLELDPEQVSQEGGSSLKFGMLRKAERFDIYEEKFRTCRKWFDSGRFMEDFLREFEKNCQQLFAQQGR